MAQTLLLSKMAKNDGVDADEVNKLIADLSKKLLQRFLSSTQHSSTSKRAWQKGNEPVE